MGKIMTTKEFISRARKKHDNLYDYSNVKYIGSKYPIDISCKEHGLFTQRPSEHLSGAGCKKCQYDKKRQSTSGFIDSANTIHDNIYNYSLTEYLSAHSKVKIICNVHGVFEQAPNDHLKGHGCRKCGCINKKVKIDTFEKFIKEADVYYGELYEYFKVDYVNINTPVNIKCKKHGIFSRTPWNHLNGSTCPECIKDIKYKMFLENANKLFGDKYDYSNIDYVNSGVKVDIKCNEHGIFEQTPYNHVNSITGGCNKCSFHGFSQLAINWLDGIMKKDNIYIQHALNEGEYLIKGTRLKADGYCKHTNTIYEFYGDVFHGNPRRYSSTQYSELCKKTFGELYQNTKSREERIEKLGYKIVSIWESEYNEQLQTRLL